MRARAAGRQFHHRHHHLVVQPRVVDALTAPDQVADVVESVEVADGGHAVLLEHVGVQLDDVARLGLERDHADAAGEGLEVGIRPGGGPEGVHDVERVFAAVEIGGLEHGPAARLQMADPAFLRRELDDGQVVLGKHPGPVDGLEPVPEGGEHEFDLLHRAKLRH